MKRARGIEIEIHGPVGHLQQIVLRLVATPPLVPNLTSSPQREVPNQARPARRPRLDGGQRALKLGIDRDLHAWVCCCHA
ncbi:MAG: hypothetical protein ACR2H2_18780 [Solirubrobacteraceae bacterium]